VKALVGVSPAWWIRVMAASVAYREARVPAAPGSGTIRAPRIRPALPSPV